MARVAAQPPKVEAQKMTRRSLLRIFGGIATTGVVLKGMGHISNLEGCIQFFSDFSSIKELLPQSNKETKDKLRRLSELKQLDADDQKLLARLFGPSHETSFSLVPAGDHHFLKPHGGYGGDYGWYPIDGQCSADFTKRFAGSDIAFKYSPKGPEIHASDTVVAFGSQVSNSVTRRYLGESRVEQPKFDLIGKGWKANLEWNLHVAGQGPRDEEVASLLNSAIHDADSSPDANIVGSEGHSRVIKDVLKYELSHQQHRFVSSTGETYEPKTGGDKLITDYLLVTSIPRFEHGGKQRVIIFAGGHGPGQKAASMIFKNPPMEKVKEIDKHIKSSRFYQALFKVNLIENANGEMFPDPDALELVGATGLKFL